MIECQIVSACDSDSRALGIDDQGNLTATQNWRSPGANQLWWVKLGVTGQVPYGMAIINEGNNKMLHVPNNGDGHVVELVENNGAFDGWSTWTFDGDRMMTGEWGNPMYGGNDSGYCAVRPYTNSDLNLNVKNGCGNSDVCVWGWGHGARNEVWRFIPTGNQSPDYYRLQSRCGSWLGFDRARNTIGMIAYDGDATLWKTDVGFSGDGIYGAGAPLGCLLTNNASGLMLAFTDQAYSDAGGLFFTTDTSQNPCIVEFFQHGDWTQIQQLGHGPSGLNVKGGCDAPGGSDVMLWPFEGHSEDLWLFHSASEK